MQTEPGHRNPESEEAGLHCPEHESRGTEKCTVSPPVRKGGWLQLAALLPSAQDSHSDCCRQHAPQGYSAKDCWGAWTYISDKVIGARTSGRHHSWVPGFMITEVRNAFKGKLLLVTLNCGKI